MFRRCWPAEARGRAELGEFGRADGHSLGWPIPRWMAAGNGPAAGLGASAANGALNGLLPDQSLQAAGNASLARSPSAPGVPPTWRQVGELNGSAACCLAGPEPES